MKQKRTLAKKISQAKAITVTGPKVVFGGGGELHMKKEPATCNNTINKTGRNYVGHLE